MRRGRRPGLPSAEQALIALDERGERVLTAYAKATPLDWLVFVEIPESEADEPLYAAITRSAIILLAGLALALLAALLLARMMVVPIRTLTAGAARIGAGTLDHRIAIKTGDELEALGEQFNHMATQLQGSYATLERKVEERTHQLQVANLAKSRFLAAASHDLRQPLHALNLFVAQLRNETDQAERDRVAGRIDLAVGNMNELFNALLDISKLDAGALNASLSDFPVSNILRHIEATFAATAREKGLLLRVVPSSAWIRSDAILLERVLLNLVSNAIRYTPKGGIVLGCRHVGDRLRIDVCDSGVGIAEDQQRNIFGEFYQIAAPDQGQRDGLGLGLAIVERLCALLKHPIGVDSTPGQGSRFHVTVPMVAKRLGLEPPAAAAAAADPLRGKLIVVVDDDALVLEGTGGLLKSWGCRVVTAASDREALTKLDGNRPDLIISDFHLHDGQTGIEVITALRGALQAPIAAFLISGDILPDRLREAQMKGLHLLHKPIAPDDIAHNDVPAFEGRRREPRHAAAQRSRRQRKLAGGPRQLPAQGRNRQHRFGPVGDVQRLEDRGHVVLHGRLGQIERAADQLVALALHHQRQHVDLPLGQAKLGRRRPPCGSGRLARSSGRADGVRFRMSGGI